MQSLREQIIRDVIARCQAAISPILVMRQPVVPIPRDRTPALVVVVESDSPVQRSNNRIERELIVSLKALSRDDSDGYAISDDIICRAHGALMADVSLGGKALGTEEADVDWLAEDADIDAVVIPARYRIRYRTMINDLTQKG